MLTLNRCKQLELDLRPPKRPRQVKRVPIKKSARPATNHTTNSKEKRK